jgi:PEGA domain
MEAQLQTGRVRLSIAANDRRLASAVVTRFLEWWEASGHRDLLIPADIEPRPDVSWNSNTASVTLPLHFTELSGIEEANDHAAPVEPGFVEFHAVARRSQAGGARDWVFEVVDDMPDADLMFPSEVASQRALDKLRRWRRHGNPVTRLTRRATAAATRGAAGMRRAVVWPWHMATRAAHASRVSSRTMARHLATGLRYLAGPRPLVRAAAVSVVLALAITASIVRPDRIVRMMRDARTAESARVSPSVATTIEKSSARVTAPTEIAVVPSRALALFRTPPRISPSSRGTAYIRSARLTIRKNERALQAAERRTELSLQAAQRKNELAAKAAQRKSELALVAAQRQNERASLAAERQRAAVAQTAAKQLAVTAPKQLAAGAPVSKAPPTPKPAASDPKPTATTGTEYTGSLVVRSEPSGAAVKIDGQVMGTTPLQIDRIKVGSHAVHVSLDGYPVWSRAATVVYGKSNDVVARLNP